MEIVRNINDEWITFDKLSNGDCFEFKDKNIAADICIRIEDIRLVASTPPKHICIALQTGNMVVISQGSRTLVKILKAKVVVEN